MYTNTHTLPDVTEGRCRQGGSSFAALETVATADEQTVSLWGRTTDTAQAGLSLRTTQT